MFLFEYALPVLFAVLLGLLYPTTSHFKSTLDKKKYYLLQLIALIAAVLGAKLVALMGDHFWPVVPLKDYWQIINSGRSLLGGLLFGHLAAELCKPLFNYRLPPNNRFAAVLPFSIAIGRVGCLLAGCCRGIPHEGFLSITYSDQIARHPEPLYEIFFQVSIGLLFILIVRKDKLEGRLFSLYLVLYGVFRFLTEFIRATPKIYHGLSVYQGVCFILIGVGATALMLRTFKMRQLKLAAT